MRDLVRVALHNVRYCLEFPRRLKSVTRISLEAELLPLIDRLKPGVIVDIGSEDSPYRRSFGESRFVTVDVVANYGADVVSDIHSLAFAGDCIDSVIATEVLEHCRDPKLAISEIYRVLKPGGTAIVTTRFICSYHPTPRDYYRFTSDSLTDLFEQFSTVEINAHGGTLQSVWSIITARQHWYYLNLLNPVIARVRSSQTTNASGFLVLATK